MPRSQRFRSQRFRWPRAAVATLGAIGLFAAACSSHSSKHAAPPATSSSVDVTPTARPSAATSDSPPVSAAGSASQTAPSAEPDAARPCGVASSGATYAHVVWIWMENKPFGSVIGSSSAPYENALAKQCGLAVDYHGIRHPSLPNYLAATGGSTFGVSDDAGPSAHRIGDQSVFGQLDSAGKSWRAYVESMPRNCATSPDGRYAVKHNPAAYYTALRPSCERSDVPLEGNLARDVADGSLPSFAFITPNLCSDTHDCSVNTGDRWLAQWIPKILSGPNYRASDTVLVLTWDEGTGSDNLIPTIVVAPSVTAGSRVTAQLDHYGLLRGTERLLGLSPLGNAATATSFASAFGL